MVVGNVIDEMELHRTKNRSFFGPETRGESKTTKVIFQHETKLHKIDTEIIRRNQTTAETNNEKFEKNIVPTEAREIGLGITL